MSNDILTSLLSDYEQKKRKAEVEFEHQKTELYKKYLVFMKLKTN